MKNQPGNLIMISLVLMAYAAAAADGDTDGSKEVRSGVENTEAQRQRLEKLWTELEKPEPAASAALLKLGVNPLATVPFLKQKLAPLKIEAAKVRLLVADLRSEKEEVWKAAAE